jgi:Xaa-Pro aminopeptidase
MFDAQTYIDRREVLKRKFNSGLLLFLGNEESPANYKANTFAFRQDSTLLYYFGLDIPGIAATIDIDNNSETIFGQEFSVDDIVWIGPQPSLEQLAERTGVKNFSPMNKVESSIRNRISKGSQVHFLPQYRSENIFKISNLLGLNSARVNEYTSAKFIKAVIEQRSIKSEAEISELDFAVDIAHKMHTAAMKMTKPGIYEKKIAGMIEGVALSLGAGMSFRPIVSKNGQTLHNPYYENLIENGDLLVNDSGAESKLHYCSDITRTIPVSGKFTDKQKEIYNIVLRAQVNAIDEAKPGITNRQLHLTAAKTITEGLMHIGLMHGNVEEAVNGGAHALFFPHGLGHMLGLDVHDMEGLGEEYVGYDENDSRSDQFGLKYLRLAKTLEPGFVFTIEPGIYFIPELIDMWKYENRCGEFINYNKVEDYRYSGGIRIEDDILITEDGHRVLGTKPIPKTVEEVESQISR